jgi:hypothetical protein
LLLPLDKDTVLEPGARVNRGDKVAPVIARQRALADSTSLKSIARAAAGLPAPLVTLVRSCTVAKKQLNPPQPRSAGVGDRGQGHRARHPREDRAAKGGHRPPMINRSADY